MSIFHPKYAFHRVYDIPPQWFLDHGISLVLLDVDNTLTTHDNPVPDAMVLNCIDQMQQKNIRLMVLSNNSEARVAPFASRLGIGYIANAAKPLAGALNRALAQMKVEKNKVALVGDQIFTDILCGNFSNVLSIWVEPIELESFPFFKFKRKMEKLVLKNFKR